MALLTPQNGGPDGLGGAVTVSGLSSNRAVGKDGPVGGLTRVLAP